MLDNRAEDLLSFWFGPEPDNGVEVARRFPVWFNATPNFDAELRTRFAATLEHAITGEFETWTETAHGSLALIIALDQLPRNLYRGNSQAFATDDRAIAVAKHGIARGFDRELSIIERLFFYIPFEHAENAEMQDRCLAFYITLDKMATATLKETTRKCIEGSTEHRDVIKRFGRFPHRNEILGRRSSAAERGWLEQHHGWGQGKTPGDN